MVLAPERDMMFDSDAEPGRKPVGGRELPVFEKGGDAVPIKSDLGWRRSKGKDEHFLADVDQADDCGVPSSTIRHRLAAGCAQVSNSSH